MVTDWLYAGEYPRDYDEQKALRKSSSLSDVYHGGNSDSTGAVTGNILGATIGYEVIPQFYKDDLVMHDLILHMADDLYRGDVTKMQT